MKLELAIVVSTTPDGCSVQLLDTPGQLAASYALPVQERHNIRPQQLVVVDLSTVPSQIMWRWFRGPVLYRRDDLVVVDNQVYQQGIRASISLIWLPEHLQQTIAVGDEVFYSYDQEASVVDLAQAGLPAHPQRLRADLLPILEELYAEMAEEV